MIALSIRIHLVISLMSAKTEAEICIGPMCYKPEPTTVQAQPTNTDLVTMIFENLTKTVHQYLTRGKNMANNYLFENHTATESSY